MATRPRESFQDFSISGSVAGILALLAFLLGYGMRGTDFAPEPAQLAPQADDGLALALIWGALLALGWIFRDKLRALLGSSERSRLVLVLLAFAPVAAAEAFALQLSTLWSPPAPMCPALAAPGFPPLGMLLPRTALLGTTVLLVLLAWERHLLGERAPARRPIFTEFAPLPSSAPAAPGEWLDFPEAPLLRVRADDVALIRSAGNYSEILANDRVHLVRVTLSDLADRLAPMGFVRVHRQTIINARGVRQVCRDATGRALIHLAGGEAVAVGRRYMAAIDTLTYRP